PAMQERRSGPPRDTRVTICCARRNALEKCENTPYCGNTIEGGDKMHLARSWVGEACVHAVRYERAHQTFSTVHENASATPGQTRICFSVAFRPTWMCGRRTPRMRRAKPGVSLECVSRFRTRPQRPLQVSWLWTRHRARRVAFWRARPESIRGG